MENNSFFGVMYSCKLSCVFNTNAISSLKLVAYLFICVHNYFIRIFFGEGLDLWKPNHVKDEWSQMRFVCPLPHVSSRPRRCARSPICCIPIFGGAGYDLGTAI